VGERRAGWTPAARGGRHREHRRARSRLGDDRERRFGEWRVRADLRRGGQRRHEYARDARGTAPRLACHAAPCRAAVALLARSHRVADRARRNSVGPLPRRSGVQCPCSRVLHFRWRRSRCSP
jgi:hypothetical protein